VTFSVFGVGNSQWAQTYQAFPTQVALGLVRAGATQVRRRHGNCIYVC
jgi:hypothetical protein